MTHACIVAEALALLGFLLAAVLYQVALLRPQANTVRYARAGLLVGTGLQALGLTAHAVHEGGQVLFGRHANIVLLLVILSVAALVVLERRTDRPALGAFFAPVLFLVVTFTVFRPVGADLQIQPWMIAHILLLMLSYVCFGIAFCMAMAYLFSDWWLKRKQVERLRLLPPLHVADNAAEVATIAGFTIYTLGMVVGAAVMLTDRLPPDAKVVFAVITWLLYAGYLIARKLMGLRGRRVQALLVVGFALVLLSFFAARHDLPRRLPQPPAASASL